MVWIGDGRHGGEVGVIHHDVPRCAAALVSGSFLQRGSVLTAKDFARWISGGFGAGPRMELLLLASGYENETEKRKPVCVA